MVVAVRQHNSLQQSPGGVLAALLLAVASSDGTTSFVLSVVGYSLSPFNDGAVVRSSILFYPGRSWWPDSAFQKACSLYWSK